jgi:hypothetical protein
VQRDQEQNSQNGYDSDQGKTQRAQKMPAPTGRKAEGAASEAKDTSNQKTNPETQ